MQFIDDYTFLGHPVSAVAPTQWGTDGTCPGHTFTNGWARGAPWVEHQTRNLPNCTDHHESAHQND